MDRKTFRKEVTLPLKNRLKAEGRTFEFTGTNMLVGGVWVANSGGILFDMAYCLGQASEYRRRRLFTSCRQALSSCRTVRERHFAARRPPIWRHVSDAACVHEAHVPLHTVSP